MTPDPILTRLLDPANDLAEVDQRHCLVFWARPPSHIRSLVAKVQDKLLPLAPSALFPPCFLRPSVSLPHGLALPQTRNLTVRFP